MCINNLLGEPGRELCTPLDPLRRGNATCKCILRMLHSLLKKPYKTFSDIPIEKKNIWFKQFATREAGGVRPDHLQVMKKVHTKKGSNVIQDPLMNEIYEKVTQTIESSQQSQRDSSSPVILSREEINRLVCEELPLKKGRRRGLGNVVSSQESFGSSSYPEDIVEQNEELKAKAADLEHKLDATQQELTTTKSELTTTRSEVATMASWMKARFPDFPGFGSSGTENPET
ncbi:hypothetical protein EUTSA_v10029449mg [Eutrema salsugineum]|uniref:Uncharacterized protein n=1 Tax=Eutrema salsugineum TaxID=72664 RepID=V4KKC8_EUTSA|nr:hypothetical protein EUTSA_v10029449mg [Eutrema salsugineum]